MASSTEQSALREEFDVEDDTVLRWRVEQFRALGFDDIAAPLLGACRIDLHKARMLVRSGCPLHLAVRILL
jgi:hypothetical protein